MVTNATERVDGLLETYLLALAGLDQCPDSAPDVVRQRLEANVEKAERAFADANAGGLLRNGPAVETAFLKLGISNEKARQAVRESRPIVALVNDLEVATRAAIEMLGAAQR